MVTSHALATVDFRHSIIAQPQKGATYTNTSFSFT